MFVVDTNVFVYAANLSSPEHAACHRLLEKWRRQSSAWYVTWGILYGFVRITTHPRVFSNPWNTGSAWQFVQALMDSRGLHVLAETDRHPMVIDEVTQEVSELRGNLISDLHVAVLMKEHGIRRIYTLDQDFHRFPFIQVLDPLKEAKTI
jgi:toxin-antitoxin system PIN domain toxin